MITHASCLFCRERRLFEENTQSSLHDACACAEIYTSVVESISKATEVLCIIVIASNRFNPPLRGGDCADCVVHMCVCMCVNVWKTRIRRRCRCRRQTTAGQRVRACVPASVTDERASRQHQRQRAADARSDVSLCVCVRVCAKGDGDSGLA